MIARATEEGWARAFRWLLVLSTVLYLPILGRWCLPSGETLRTAQVSFHVLNGMVQDGACPLWLPCYAWGSPGGEEIGAAMGPSLWTLFPLSLPLERVNAMRLLYGSFWLDELILLVGVFRLSRRLFSGPSAAGFVCVSVLGSTVWGADVWGSLRGVAFLPLGMDLAWSGLKEGRAWKLGAALAFAWTGSFGNPPGYVLHAGWTLAVFSIAASFALGTPVPGLLRGSRRAVALSVLAAAAVLGLRVLVGWGGGVHPAEGGWSPMRSAQALSGLFTGTIPHLEASLYVGVLALAFAALSLARRDARESFPFVVLAGASLLAGFWTPSALGVLRVSLCFLAGYGVDAWQSGLERSGTGDGGRPALQLIKAVAALGILFLALATAEAWRLAVLERAVQGMAPGEPMSLERTVSRLSFTGLVLIAGLLLAVMPRIADLPSRRLLVWGALALQAVDVMSFRSFYAFELVRSAPSDIWRLHEPRPAPFQPARERSGFDLSVFRAYVRYFQRTIFIERKGADVGAKTGTLHHTVETFLGADAGSTVLRLDHRPAAAAELESLLRGRNPHAGGAESPSVRDRILGVGFPKLQLFREATPLSRDAMRRWLLSPAYRGDRLLVDGGEGGLAPAEGEPPLAEGETDHRIDAEVKVVRFSPCRIDLEVDAGKGGWLYYADGWDPAWRATVGGRETRVLRANLAFKAIALPPGRSVVRWEFQPEKSRLLPWILGALFGGMALWLGCQGWILAGLPCFRRR